MTGFCGTSFSEPNGAMKRQSQLPLAKHPLVVMASTWVRPKIGGSTPLHTIVSNMVFMCFPQNCRKGYVNPPIFMQAHSISFCWLYQAISRDIVTMPPHIPSRFVVSNPLLSRDILIILKWNVRKKKDEKQDQSQRTQLRPVYKYHGSTLSLDHPGTKPLSDSKPSWPLLGPGVSME